MTTTTLDELIASWKARRAFLLKQLEVLEAKQREPVDANNYIADRSYVEQDIGRIRSWVSILEELLAQHHSLD